jgi:uncharacterized protein YcnI
MKRRRLAMAVAALAALALPASAQAHVFVEQTEAPADAFPIIDFVVPHGCDGSPTTSLSVRFPKSVPQVTPEVVPGWEVSTEEGPKKKAELFGETITRGVSEVTWTATGEPLADHRLQRFGAELKLPNSEGQTVYFPAIQRCQQGQTRWIQIPGPGETEEDLEEPAPAIALTAAEPEHGASGDTATADETGASGDTAAADETGASGDTASTDKGDFASQGLGVAALIVGGVGILLGGAGLLRRR